MAFLTFEACSDGPGYVPETTDPVIASVSNTKSLVLVFSILVENLVAIYYSVYAFFTNFNGTVIFAFVVNPSISKVARMTLAVVVPLVKKPATSLPRSVHIESDVELMCGAAKIGTLNLSPLAPEIGEALSSLDKTSKKSGVVVAVKI